jgi:hypothetical protein
MPEKNAGGFWKWVVLVVILWGVSPFIVHWLFESGRLLGESTSAARGQLGDMFGAVNALFTGLAFAGTLYLIALQRQTFADQQREMEKQQQAQEKIAGAMDLQAQTLKAELQLLQARQAEAEERLFAASLPAFVMHWTPARYVNGAAFNVENVGAPIFAVRIESDEADVDFSNENTFWPSRETRLVEFRDSKNEQSPLEKLRFKIVFETARGNEREELYEVERMGAARRTGFLDRKRAKDSGQLPA